MAQIYEMAKELGAALARTDEYQALKRASEAAEDDRELVELRNKLQSLERDLESQLRAGKEPDEEVKKEYTDAAEALQGMAAFQRVVAAQTNFEKVMQKVNETVAKGIEEGAQSKIIISS